MPRFFVNFSSNACTLESLPAHCITFVKCRFQCSNSCSIQALFESLVSLGTPAACKNVTSWAKRTITLQLSCVSLVSRSCCPFSFNQSFFPRALRRQGLESVVHNSSRHSFQDAYRIRQKNHSRQVCGDAGQNTTVCRIFGLRLPYFYRNRVPPRPQHHALRPQARKRVVWPVG